MSKSIIDKLLTLREREVLWWAAEGKSASEIAAILHIAKRTVEAHTRNTARKLGATNKTHAVSIGLREGLVGKHLPSAQPGPLCKSQHAACAALHLGLDAGRPANVLGTLQEISERVALEEKLAQSGRMEVLGQLAGGIAHDFNNLLTVILGNVEDLTEALPDDSELRLPAPTRFLIAAEPANELTSRLLAYARRQTLIPKSIDVSKQINELIPFLRRTLPKSIEITARCATDLWNVVIDPGQFDTAMLNLALNARDAMPDGGRLSVGTANQTVDANVMGDDLTFGDYVCISMSDNGSGMDETTRHRAFEPFFTTKELGKGTGLGLSMVCGLMKQANGHARIWSQPGCGTTVRLYLPRA